MQIFTHYFPTFVYSHHHINSKKTNHTQAIVYLILTTQQTVKIYFFNFDSGSMMRAPETGIWVVVDDLDASQVAGRAPESRVGVVILHLDAAEVLAVSVVVVVVWG